MGRPTRISAIAGVLAVVAVVAAILAARDRRAGSGAPSRGVLVVTTDAARHAPGSAVRITVDVAGAGADAVRLRMSHLGEQIGSAQHAATGDRATHTFSWTPPPDDYRGYLVRADALDGAGAVVGTGHSAVDVSSDSARFPRYGFVSSYDGDVDPDAVAGYLRRHHITDVQFYDWNWRHHLPLAGTPASPHDAWTDLANRTNRRGTVLELIERVQAAGGDALSYNLVYGADDDYANDGSGVDPGWGLYRSRDCTDQDAHPLPPDWAVDRIHLMDPANPGWQSHLAAKENDAFAAYPFAGIQADQLGGRGSLHTCAGEPVDLAGRFDPWIDAFAASTGKKIVFNAVGQYGQQQVADNPSLPYLYTEAWPEAGQASYADLKKVIEDNRSWSGGKGTVLAAYVNRALGASPGRFNTPGVLTADAVIFAAGGAHNELGDVEHMLSNEYYPNANLTIDAGLAAALRRYYDFLVAYQNLLRDSDVEASEATTVMPGISTSGDGQGDTVWTFAKRKGEVEIVHFINLLGNADTSWVDADGRRAAPPVLENVSVRHYYEGDPPASVSFASPDRDGGEARRLSFRIGHDDGGAYVEFALPRLDYWDTVWLS